MNHTLFFPYDNFIDVAKDEPWTPPKSLKDINDPNWYRNDKNWSLWTIILQNVMLGKLTVYNSEPNREMIAESGKMKVSEVVSYFKARAPHADIKSVKEQAKEMIAEAKAWNR